MAGRHWVHDLDPFAIQISEGIGIRWYGLSYLIGIVIGWALIKRWTRRGMLNTEPSAVDDLVLYFGIGIIGGGRLGYCLLYQPDLLITFESSVPFWGVLAMHQGGMSSHGGMIGMLIAGILFMRKFRCSLAMLADLVTTCAVLGAIFGRLANFINGELYGRISSVAWAIHFPTSIVETPYAERVERWHQVLQHQPDLAHATWQQLATTSGVSDADRAWYQALADGTASLPLDAADPLLQRTLANSWQFAEAHLLTPDQPWYADAWRVLVEPRHPSQLYALVTEGVIPLTAGLITLHTTRRPGLTCGVVLMAYGIGRIVNESFRQWDIGHDPLFGLLTKGQLYSVPMLIIGGSLAFWAWRRGARPELYVATPAPSTPPSEPQPPAT